MKVREYFDSVKAQLVEYNDKLQSDLVEAQAKNKALQKQIEQERQNTSEAQQRFMQEAKKWKSELMNCKHITQAIRVWKELSNDFKGKDNRRNRESA